MGQKVNPISLRLGINRGWDSIWFAKKREYGKFLIEDFKIRENIKKNVAMELDLQQQLTIEQLESEWRREMEADLTRLQQETMHQNEQILRGEFEQRLIREQGQLFDQIRTEKERRLEEFRNQTNVRLENELKFIVEWFQNHYVEMYLNELRLKRKSLFTTNSNCDIKHRSYPFETY